MLTDEPSSLLFSKCAPNGERTWLLAIVCPDSPEFDRACAACGTFDNLSCRMDLADFSAKLQERKRRCAERGVDTDCILNTMINVVASADAIHPLHVPADLAFCKTCFSSLNARTHQALPLQALAVLLRTAESVPCARSMDLRVVHKICVSLAEEGYYGCNPYMACFYQAECKIIKTIAAHRVEEMRPLLASFYLAQNNGSKYLRPKAVEFLRNHLAREGGEEDSEMKETLTNEALLEESIMDVT